MEKKFQEQLNSKDWIEWMNQFITTDLNYEGGQNRAQLFYNSFKEGKRVGTNSDSDVEVRVPHVVNSVHNVIRIITQIHASEKIKLQADIGQFYIGFFATVCEQEEIRYGKLSSIRARQLILKLINSFITKYPEEANFFPEDF